MRVLILGVNGFIGSHLSEKILSTTDWDVYGLDVESNKISNIMDSPRFHFLEGDIMINKEWVEYNIKKCDVLLPLVAIATPATYVKYPLKVFELDFESNLEMIKKAVKYNTRVVFPSTSEVYGMCTDEVFDEDNSNFILGPTNKQRWIYSCCKQLLDRVLWAYGFEKDFRFTIFRPYNWIGPRLDDINTNKDGSSRVLTQFIGSVLNNKPIELVNGGHQRRCFLYIDDGIDCLMKIVENKNGCCDKTIFNIGNPDNDITIRELAHKVRKVFLSDPVAREKKIGKNIVIKDVDHRKFYGEGYQDVSFRVPSIEKAKKVLRWRPKVDMDAALKKTLGYYIREFER